MEYNEDLAIRFAAQHRLSHITVGVWKYRNHIPDSYLEGKRWRIKHNYCSEAEENSIKNLINDRRINLRGLCRVAGIEYDIIHQVKRNRIRLFEKDFRKIKKVINAFKNDILKLVNNLTSLYSEQRVKNILTNELICLKYVLEIDSRTYRQVNSYIRNKRQRFEDLPFKNIINKILSLYLLISSNRFVIK